MNNNQQVSDMKMSPGAQCIEKVIKKTALGLQSDEFLNRQYHVGRIENYVQPVSQLENSPDSMVGRVTSVGVQIGTSKDVWLYFWQKRRQLSLLTLSATP
jgi:hypothetical protein